MVQHLSSLAATATRCFILLFCPASDAGVGASDAGVGASEAGLGAPQRVPF